MCHLTALAHEFKLIFYSADLIQCLLCHAKCKNTPGAWWSYVTPGYVQLPQVMPKRKCIHERYTID